MSDNKRKYRALVIATGGPVHRLENRYAAEQWLMGEIIKQHSGNGWQQQWPAGGKNDSARLSVLKSPRPPLCSFSSLNGAGTTGRLIPVDNQTLTPG